MGRCRQQRAHFAWVVFEINADGSSTRLDLELAQDKKFLELFVRNGSEIASCVAVQDNRGFQRVADQFLLPRALDRLADYGAQIQ